MLFNKFYNLLLKLDKILLVNYLSYDEYFRFHRFLGFPLKKMLFKRRNGYRLNLSNPKTFNEKVCFRSLFSDNELFEIIVDKENVRKFVEGRIGAEYLIPVIGVYKGLEEIDFDGLPNDCIIKSTHGSKQCEIRRDGKFNKPDLKIKAELKKWLIEKYRFQQLITFVQKLERKIIVEELLISKDGNIPEDYKFYVFQGNVELIQVDIGRFGEHRRSFFDVSWKLLDLEKELESAGECPEPENLADMISVASVLGELFSFIRVDLYNLDGKIYFGELTPAPAQGLSSFRPYEWDMNLGKKWDLKEKIESFNK